MPNMIQTQIMHNHSIPVVIQHLARHMPRHIIIDFGEILTTSSTPILLLLHTEGRSSSINSRLTETKKLDVPSARPKNPGNSFNHVSSPYMTSLPPSLARSWASHVSWSAREEVVSDSRKLRITSRKVGTEPVVMAFTRGMVMVGEVAWAVKGMAKPSRMRLEVE